MGWQDYQALKEVSQANRAFYEAFSAGDYASMVELWLDEDSIVCVHPGGEVLQGRLKVHGSWRAILADESRMQIELVDSQPQVAGEVAWVTLTERLHYGPPEDRRQAETTATNLFQRRAGRWWVVLRRAGPLTRRFYEPEE